MSAAKLRIDLSQGFVEVEGDEGFVRDVYDYFKDRVNATARIPGKPDAQHADPSHNDKSTSATSPKKSKRRTAAASGADGGKAKKKVRGAVGIVKDLDLSGSKAGRLKDHFANYAPKTNYERNLIFIDFMQEKMGLTGITEDHVFTCYREMGQRIPRALRQSLLETAGDRGWIDVSDWDDITLTVHGINYLQHEMARAGTTP